MRITEWEFELLKTLGWKVRAITVRQLQELLGGNVARRVRALESKGLIESTYVSVGAYAFKCPLVRWPSKTWRTDLSRAPHQLTKRWRSLSCRQEQVLWISQRGIELNGGFGGRLRQRLQLQHDLGTSHVFLCQTKSAQSRWVGEDWLRNRHDFPSLGKLPDAVLVDDRDRLSKVIEFGGQYTKADLRRLHETCSRLEVPYELW